MSEKQEAEGCNPGSNPVCWGGGGFINRCLALVFSLGSFIALAIALAGNNSIVLPETSALENISVDINILGGGFLQRSVNIFGGIFIGLTVIGLIYSIVVMVLLFFNMAYIVNNWGCFSRILIALDSLMMFAHLGLVAGAYFVASLLGAHSQLDPDHPAGLGMARVGLWVAFGFSSAAYGQFFGTVIVSSISYGRQCKEKCDKNKCGVNDDGNEKLNLH